MEIDCWILRYCHKVFDGAANFVIVPLDRSLSSDVTVLFIQAGRTHLPCTENEE